jgi:hypothetical protein
MKESPIVSQEADLASITTTNERDNQMLVSLTSHSSSYSCIVFYYLYNMWQSAQDTMKKEKLIKKQ